MKITKEYLKSLNYEELLKLYDDYYRMGNDIIRFDVEQGLAVLDEADIIKFEINNRNNMLNDTNKIKIKK